MKILVVDDERDVVSLIALAFNLYRPDYSVVEAYGGEEAIRKVAAEDPDLMILDVAMPALDGYEVCRRVREKSELPIIMLTAKTLEADKIKGLELGADDYVTKPFGHRELMARVDAVLRRSRAAYSPPKPDRLECRDLVIDFLQRQVIVQGKPIKLTKTEYALLHHLARNAGRVLTQSTLLAKVWGYEYKEEVHYLKVFVRRLREKIEADPGNPRYILTERGVGYRFNVD